MKLIHGLLQCLISYIKTFYILQFGKSENLVQSKLGLKKHTLKNSSVFN